jgi:hypothetical protein
MPSLETLQHITEPLEKQPIVFGEFKKRFKETLTPHNDILSKLLKTENGYIFLNEGEISQLRYNGDSLDIVRSLTFQLSNEFSTIQNIGFYEADEQVKVLDNLHRKFQNSINEIIEKTKLEIRQNPTQFQEIQEASATFVSLLKEVTDEIERLQH